MEVKNDYVMFSASNKQKYIIFVLYYYYVNHGLLLFVFLAIFQPQCSYKIVLIKKECKRLFYAYLNSKMTINGYPSLIQLFLNFHFFRTKNYTLPAPQLIFLNG